LPNIKAAEKWARQTDKRTIRNKDTTSRLRTLYKKAASSGDAEAAKTVESQFDKAAKSGIIHKNKAARKKSRLAKAMMRAAPLPVAKAKTTGRKATAKKK
jgi:small subunit ribosomal protein S20